MATLGSAKNGVEGSVTIPTAALSLASTGTALAIGHITLWNADVQHEIFDTTPFQTSSPNNFREKTGGLVHIVGSCEGFMDSKSGPDLVRAASSQLVDTEGRADAGFVLKWSDATSDGSYTFKGIISNLNMRSEKRGMSTFSLNFESSGASDNTANTLVTQSEATS